MRLSCAVCLITTALLVALLAGTASARFEPRLAGITGGAGVTDFGGGAYRARTTSGGAWDLRLIIGTRTPFAFEVGYVGTAQLVDDPVGRDPTLSSSSVEGVARVNLGNARIQPFLTGGAGWIYYQNHGGEQAPVAGRELLPHQSGIVLPVGAGIAARLGRRLFLDTRFTYRFVTASLAPSGAETPTPLAGLRPDHWTAMIRGGYSF